MNKSVRAVISGVMVAIFVDAIGIEGLSKEWWTAIITLNAAIIIS